MGQLGPKETMDNLTYTFRSGYTIRLDPQYKVMLIRQAVQAYRDKHKPPTPPIQRIPQANDKVREIILDKDDIYLAARYDYNQNLIRFEEQMKMRLGFDPNSIDRKLVAEERKKLKERNIETLGNDTELYLMLVTEPEHTAPELDANNQPILDDNGNPKIKVIQPPEIKDLFDWLDNNTGNQSAVMQRHLEGARAEFRQPDMGQQTNLETPNVQQVIQQTAAPQPAGQPNGNGSSQPFPTVSNLVNIERSGPS